MLETSAALSESYDLAMLDLDGVVYIGAEAVPGIAGHLGRARSQGMHLAFVTNNAARSPEHVAAHLNELGVDASPHDIVTSAQAAAHLLAGECGAGARVFCLGSDALAEAMAAEGLVPVTTREDAPAAVVTGYGPDVPWRTIMLAGMLIRDGLPWVACNGDLSVPTPHGPGPGHGVQVRMLADFAGVLPRIAGKPQRPLLDETVRRVGGHRPLMIGDRLDTDIEGANNAGVDSLLVLTGVTGLSELVRARPAERPTYLAADLGGLFVPHASPAAVPGERPHAHELGGWCASSQGDRLLIEGQGSVADWWRVVAAASWARLDETGEAVDADHLRALVPSPGPDQGTVMT